MRLKVMSVLAVCSMLSTSGQGMIVTYPQEPAYSVGQGANTATLAVDFGTRVVVFQYAWDGAATGWDALVAVDAAGDLSVRSTDYTAWDWGMFVKDIAYPGAAKFDYGTANRGWAYFNSENGSVWSEFGASCYYRPLSNGSWDCWLWSNYDSNWMTMRTPGQAAIPEPVTLALLGLGGLMLNRSKSR
jgi:hypothetical protein